MAGYISPNGKTGFAGAPEGTIFSKALLELRDVVTTMNPQPQIVVRNVDVNVSAPVFSDLELSKASLSRGIFAGKSTNLAGAIKSFTEPLEKDSEDQAPPRFKDGKIYYTIYGTNPNPGSNLYERPFILPIALDQEIVLKVKIIAGDNRESAVSTARYVRRLKPFIVRNK